ncbi:MAG: hypothetical protein OXG38_07660 [Chloroflexi bacterium]|nr:hypothetical protein [Chloroflexota bacterium]
MNLDVLATVLTGAGVLIGVWRMVDGMRREMNARLDSRFDALNARIDAVLLADRKP